MPASRRKPSGHRLYPLSAVPHLRRVRDAIALGHRPAETLTLSPDALEALVASGQEAQAGKTPDRSSRGRSIPTPPPGEIASDGARRPRIRAGRDRYSATTAAADPETVIESLLEAVLALDREALFDALEESWGTRDPVDFLESLVRPFMERVGALWREGSLSIRHEHFASNRLADFLREARRTYDSDASGPVVAFATTSDERHEIGLLMAALAFARRGYRVLYLGTDTPADQLVALAEEGAVDGIAISFSATAPRAYAFAIVRELRRSLPEEVRLYVGGAGAPPAPSGVLWASDLTTLDRALAEGASN